MSYARERQYTKAQSVKLICDFLREHEGDEDFSFTIRDIMRLTGRGYQATYYLLVELDEVLGTYIEREQGRQRGGRWGSVRRRVLRER